MGATFVGVEPANRPALPRTVSRLSPNRPVPPGTILTANANFLDAVGYDFSEIVGRHHSVFVAPADNERLRENVAQMTVLEKNLEAQRIRVEKLLMAGLGLSRSAVKRAVDSGRVRLPMAVDARARGDFAFVIG